MKVEFNLNAIERKWQEKWFSQKVFEPEFKEGKEKFFMTIPYPYVSGPLHVGHGRTYTAGDVIARFKRMKGFQVLLPMAFHITGTPVLAISARIAEKDSEAIRMYLEYVKIYEKDEEKAKKIVESFVEPWNVVNYFSQKIIEDFKSIGFSLDFSRAFTTGDKEYNKFIQWQFKKYRKKRYLTQGAYPILYCTSCKNAVGEDDIVGGDVEPVELMRFCGIKSEFEKAFIISCTLRPETVFGITNLFVKPDATYVRIRVSIKEEVFGGQEKTRSEEWIVSKESLDKLRIQGKNFEVIEEKKGVYFVGKYCRDPLGKEIPVLPGEFVDPSSATGWVHSVPAHAPYDYIGIEELKKEENLEKHPELKEILEKIKPVGLIRVPGYGEFPAIELCQKRKITSLSQKEELEKATKDLYKEEFYTGVMKDNSIQFSGSNIAEAKEKVFAWLSRNKKCEEFFETSRQAQCRCGGSVVVAVLQDQWFLDFNAHGWKEKAFDCLNEITIYPERYRKQFEDVFNWLDKRPCARRRGLGTKLPFDENWIIESLSDSTIYMSFYTIIKKIREKKIPEEKMSEEFFDYIFLGIGDAENIAREANTSIESIEEIRQEFLNWYPNDHRHTAVAHITNHLSFFIFAHAAIFSREHWPKAITLNEMIISEGAKMSKSKGNVILLNDIGRNYSADLFRLYCTGSADFASVLDFRAEDVEKTRKSLIKFIHLMEELIQKRKPVEKIESRIVKFMLSRFEKAVRESTMALEEFRLRDYVQTAFYGVMNDLEQVYRRAGEEEKNAIASEITGRWIKLLAPVIPHVCEELNELMGEKKFVSLSEWPSFREEFIDEEIEKSEKYVNSVLEDARSVMKLVKIKATGLKLVVAKEEKNKEIKNALREAKKEEDLNSLLKDDALRKFASKRFYELKELLEETDIKEENVLTEAKEFIRKELGLKEVIVEKEEESKEEKAERAMPLKPALILY